MPPPPTPTSAPSTETWAAIITAIAGAAAVAIKRKFTRKQPKSDIITRTEFHQGLDAMRDRLTAAYLAMGEKMDANHREILTAIAHQGDTFEARLDHLETNVARVDERTKLTDH